MNTEFVLKHDPLRKKVYLTHYFGKSKIVTIPNGVTDIMPFAFVNYESSNEIKTNSIIEEITFIHTLNNTYVQKNGFKSKQVAPNVDT